MFLPGWKRGFFLTKINRGKRSKWFRKKEDWLMLELQEPKKLSFLSMNRFYQGDWIDSMASRFIDELPKDYLQKNFFDENDSIEDDFEFNQDLDNSENIKSPGWIRYQKRIK